MNGVNVLFGKQRYTHLGKISSLQNADKILELPITLIASLFLLKGFAGLKYRMGGGQGGYREKLGEN